MFLLPAVFARAGPSNDEYLKVFLRLNDAEQLEKEGHLRQAYTLYGDCLQGLLVFRKDPDWQISLLDKRIHDIAFKLEWLKSVLINPPPPTSTDATFNEFMDSLGNRVELKKFQNRHPDWDPILIADLIAKHEVSSAPKSSR